MQSAAQCPNTDNLDFLILPVLDYFIVMQLEMCQWWPWEGISRHNKTSEPSSLVSWRIPLMMDGFATETAIGSTKCSFVSSHVSFITHWRSPLMRTWIRTGIMSLQSELELKLYHF